MVYLAETPAAALLEVCVHTCASDGPQDYTLLKVAGPETSVFTIRIEELPSDWQTRREITRDLGTKWLRGQQEVLLRVPSAIVPETSNFLFNPLHPDANGFRIEALNQSHAPRSLLSKTSWPRW